MQIDDDDDDESGQEIKDDVVEVYKIEDNDDEEDKQTMNKGDLQSRTVQED